MQKDLHHKALSPASLKARMRTCGLSYRRAGPLLGNHHQYIWDILAGRRLNSGILLRRRLDALLTEIEEGRITLPPARPSHRGKAAQ